MAIIWINRKWQDVSASGIPLNDRGLLHGCAAFETMRVVDGRVQHLEKHRARLEATSKALSLPSVELLDLLEIIGLLCEKNHCASGHARVRLTVTAGEGTLWDSQLGKNATMWISAQPFTPNLKTISAVLLPWRRNEHSPLSGMKTASYAENLLAKRWAHQQGYDEGIFLNTAGNLCEGSTSNLFLVINQVLYTPDLSSGCLPGVMRAVVLEQAAALGIPCLSTPLSANMLEEADELFFTSALQGIIPANRLGCRILSAPGLITEKLLDIGESSFQ
jgi:branched-subunit amino acid aminotransferase/4-amino-4-deoxychorismate lyase